ncbi:MAG: hypothetical protein AB1765_05605 [Candidatus Hydrogenedentota bacterium]
MNILILQPASYLTRLFLFFLSIYFFITNSIFSADDTLYIKIAMLNKELDEIDLTIIKNNNEIERLSQSIGESDRLNLVKRIINRKNLKELHKLIEENEENKNKKVELLKMRENIYFANITDKEDKILEIMCGICLKKNQEEIEKQKTKIEKAANVDEKMKNEKRLIELIKETDEIQKKYEVLNKKYQEKTYGNKE